jgi:hypothetical protein
MIRPPSKHGSGTLAVSEKKKLILTVPAHCEFSPLLEELIETCGKAVVREDA